MTTETKKSPFKGVTYLAKKNRWQARITLSGKSYSLGIHKDRDVAEAVYAYAYSCHPSKVKAWSQRDWRYRGPLIDAPTPVCEHPVEIAKIKAFSFLVDGDEDRCSN